MKFLKRYWYFALLVPLTLMMGFNIVGMLTKPSPVLPRPVDVQNAGRILTPASGNDMRDPMPPTATVGGNGVVEPTGREVRVAGSVAGRITAIHAVEGAVVAAGAPLVELDAAVLDAQLATADADIATARAQLTKVTKGNRIEDIRAARADADAAHARTALSQGVLTRTQAAATGGGASADEVDRAKRQAEVDRAAAASAQARYAAIANGARAEDIAVAEAQVAAAEARRAQVQADRERLTVHAPSGGEILQVKFRVGEYYQPGGEPLVTMGDTSELRVRIDVDERDVGRVAVGAAAVVRANAFPQKDFAGKVVEIARRMGRKNVRSDDPVERNDTKILEVVIALPNAKGLIVGQRVTGFVSAPEAAPPAANPAANIVPQQTPDAKSSK